MTWHIMLTVLVLAFIGGFSLRVGWALAPALLATMGWAIAAVTAVGLFILYKVTSCLIWATMGVVRLGRRAKAAPAG